MGSLSQGQLQIWTEHSTLILLDLRILEISKKSSLILKIGKVAFYNQINLNLTEAYDYASNVMVENMLKLDAEEGIEAFINKRAPKWQDK